MECHATGHITFLSGKFIQHEHNPPGSGLENRYRVTEFQEIISNLDHSFVNFYFAVPGNSTTKVASINRKIKF